MLFVDRAVRRELDRMAGEIHRRQDEVDVCLRLLAKRELLRDAAMQCRGCRATARLWRLVGVR